MSLKRTIAAVGDIVLSGSLSAEPPNASNVSMTRDLEDFFKNADLVTGNLEAPVTDSKSSRKGQLWTLRTPIALAPVLSVFDGMSVANNHILDFGTEGLVSTLSQLDHLGIRHCGAGLTREEAAQPAFFDLNGFRVGMLAFADRNWYPVTATGPGTNVWQGKESEDAITRLSKETAFLVVQFHQGYEFLDYPGPEEWTMAEKVTSAGADLVLFHHSHTLMGIKRFGDSACAFGLGNFIFDNSSFPAVHREKISRRAVFCFDVSEHRVDAWRVQPFTTDARGWPVAAVNRETGDIPERVRTLSLALQNKEEAIRSFRAQAAERMVPHAWESLCLLLRKEGARAVVIRLMRLRWVDVTVLLASAWRRLFRTLQRQGDAS